MEICISDVTEVKEDSSGPHQLIGGTAGRTRAQRGECQMVISHGEAGGGAAGAPSHLAGKAELHAASGGAGEDAPGPGCPVHAAPRLRVVSLEHGR